MANLSAPMPRRAAFVRFSDWLAGLVGWRRRGVAFLAGAVATLALPPAYGLPALYLAFPVLVWLLAGAANRRAAFGLGWWFGFGYFATSLYWIGNAMLVFAAKHAWMVPFAALGLPAFLALFTGLATLVARNGRSHLERALWLAVAWVAVEWVRGHVLTGFPWNLVGQSWAASDGLIQFAAVGGIYAVSLLAVLSACLPAALADGRPGVRTWLPIGAAVALVVVPWIGGTARLALAPSAGEAVQPGIGLRIVQAGIPQREKWRHDLRRRNTALHVKLSTENRPDWITHIIWPENAATFFVNENPLERQALTAAIPAGGLLITGAPRRERRPLRIWNSIFAIDGTGKILGHYDKAHLVPFGEYAPLRDVLPIDKITHGAVDYSAGPGVRTLRLPGLPPVSPLICYEAIFPGAVVDPSDRPAWMLNLTNDAWYGITAGPHQHLAIARVRAVEEGLPMIRAANTGISAIIGPYGRVLVRLGLTKAGVLDGPLPAPTPNATIYARFGDIPFFVMLVLFAVFLGLRHSRVRAKP